jgi:hypothetical protein
MQEGPSVPAIRERLKFSWQLYAVKFSWVIRHVEMERHPAVFLSPLSVYVMSDASLCCIYGHNGPWCLSYDMDG